MIKTVEAGLKQRGWYEEYTPKSSDRHAYRPLKHAGKHRELLDDEYWGDKLPAIRKLIETIRTWKTERCEIFSTVYAAWNDLLIWSKPVSDDAILDEILNRWHEKKRDISEKDWRGMMAWMRDKGYVPTGFGRATREQSLFES
jgi:type I restriction enzyme S subunit